MAHSGLSRSWTEDELIEVISLYCQIPFGQMHSRNPAVIELARSLKRSASSIALKLVNFASFDPGLRSRGVRGMSNASKLDRAVWNRYFGNWDALASVKNAPQIADDSWTKRPTAAKRLTVTRLGQGFFRNAVLAAYDGKCCITAVAAPQLLRASHIIPWSVSKERRLDPSNGICLNALHDAAFDAGLIGFDEDLCILVSKATRDLMPQAALASYFSCYEGNQIRPPERFMPDRQGLRYHLENVFIS